MQLSDFLGRVMGFYLVALSLALLMGRIDLPRLRDELLKSSFLLLLSALFALILGLMIVVSHSVWEASWRLIITLFGYAALLKGLIILYFPQSYLSAVEFYVKKRIDRMIAPLLLALGLWLLYWTLSI